MWLRMFIFAGTVVLGLVAFALMLARLRGVL
jgi:hypothetical protein